MSTSSSLRVRPCETPNLVGCMTSPIANLCPCGGSQAGYETGHDDDGQHLHGALHGNGKEEVAHHSTDFVEIRIGPPQLHTHPQIGRQQVAYALDRHQRDESEGGRNPAELWPWQLEKPQIPGKIPARGT